MVNEKQYLSLALSWFDPGHGPKLRAFRSYITGSKVSTQKDRGFRGWNIYQEDYIPPDKLSNVLFMWAGF